MLIRRRPLLGLLLLAGCGDQVEVLWQLSQGALAIATTVGKKPAIVWTAGTDPGVLMLAEVGGAVRAIHDLMLWPRDIATFLGGLCVATAQGVLVITDQGGSKRLIHAEDEVHQVAADQGGICWIEPEGGRVMYEQDRQQIQLARDPQPARSIDMDADFVYWTSAAGVKRVHRQSHVLETLSSEPAQDVLCANGTIYWSYGRQIHKLGQQSIVSESTGVVSALRRAGSGMIWHDAGVGLMLPRGAVKARVMALTTLDNHVYWADLDKQAICRTSLR